MLGLHGLCATIFATLSSRSRGEVEQAREVRGMPHPVDVMPEEKLREPAPKHAGGKKQHPQPILGREARRQDSARTHAHMDMTHMPVSIGFDVGILQ